MNDSGSGDAPHRLIEWTGERCVPWTGDLQVVYEHYHRYLLARPLVAGLRVLDLASGEGYGSALLAESATSVVGLEIDPESVAHSRQTYSVPGLEFVEGSMLDLSALPDASVDVVTCFEALEHIAEHDELLAGVRRVLTPGGVFLTSTPDRLRYTEELQQHNPHHVRELSRDEFVELLSGTFPHVRVWGQVVAIGSLVQEIGTTSGGTEVLPLAQTGTEEWIVQDAYPPTYFLAAASARELPPMPAQSVLVDVDMTLVRGTQRELADRTTEVAAVRADVEILTGALETLRADHDEVVAHLTSLDERDQRAREQLGRLEAEAAEAGALVSSLEGQRDDALRMLAEERTRSEETAGRLAAAQRELGAVMSSHLHRGASAIQRALGRGRR